MNKMLDKYDIIVTPNSFKISILNCFSQNKIIHNIKFYTLDEFMNNYLYKKDVLYYICNKYNVIPDVGVKILNSLKYIKNITNDERLNELYKIKENLILKGYIEENTNLKKFIEGKKVCLYNYYNIDKYYLDILKNLNVDIINEDVCAKKLNVYEFNNIEEEVVFNAVKIVDLINNGVDINNIKIVIFNEYRSVINRIFSMFNIPYSFINKNKIISYDITRYFLDLIDSIDSKEEVINILKDSYDLNREINNKIYTKLINILNKYDSDLYLIKDIVKYEVKHEVIDSYKYNNVVEEIKLEDYDYNTDNYVFIFGFNYGNIPLTYNDDDYLTDKEKEILNIDTSLEKNEKEVKNVIIYLNKINNLYITYKLKTPFNDYNPSNLVEDANILKYTYDYSNRNYNDYLMCNMLDNLIKYNEEDENLNKIYHKSDYLKFNNSYKNIGKTSLVDYLNNSINLSYSSMEVFYKCKFRFYLNNILKIDNDIEDTNSIIVGKIVHSVLCHIYKENVLDYEKVIEEEIEKYYLDNNITFKDKFYSAKYKVEILKIIEILNSQNDRCEFKDGYYEKYFEVKKDSYLNVKVVGFIDKVLIFNDNVNMYVIIVDYKTGTIKTDFNNVCYGLNMQLLIYLYLLKHNYSNVKCAGMYYQNIVKEVFNSDKNKTYDDVLYDSYKLAGYTLNDISVLEKIDKCYENSYIKGIRLKANNDFYSTCKVLSESEIDRLLEIVDENIDFVIKEIENANFDINPKRIGTEDTKNITGCAFCGFRDICYRKKDDIVSLEKTELEDFIGGEKDGQSKMDS